MVLVIGILGDFGIQTTGFAAPMPAQLVVMEAAASHAGERAARAIAPLTTL
ncbi:hypothetical protein [Cupriavidus basilensis]|uniref:hypothetical protein n=1 Tax=Cupriavidus basilensis TaxID=68895 RepID=UPI003F5B267D